MIELLEHNVETYKNLCDEMEKHNKVALIQATGTGKSYIISKYIEEHCHNALVLVPANAIGDQWQKLLPDVEVKTYQAMAKGIDGEYDLIVADEMHHLGSDVWGQKFIEYFMQNPEQKVIGATATEIRYLDNARDMVEEIFDGIAVRGVDLATAIDRGILPTFKYVTAYYGSEEDFNEYREKVNSIKDCKQRNDLGKRLEMCIQNRVSIKTAMYENLNMEKHNIIVFLNGLCEIDKAIEMFTETFPNCECNYVSSKRTGKENETNIFRFQQSENQISILLAVDMLNEGVHIEGTDTVVMFRNTESPQVYFQQIGRVLDTHSNRSRVVFDFVCNASNIKMKMSGENEFDVLKLINETVQEKKRKIILKCYTKDIQNILDEIYRSISCKFTEREKKIILNNTDKTCNELARLIGKNSNAVYAFCKRNGINIKREREFEELSDKQKKYMQEHIGIKPHEVAKEIGVNRETVVKYWKTIGIHYEPMKMRRFTKYEKEFIKSNTNMTAAELAKVLGRKRDCVAGYCNRNGIVLKRERCSQITEKDIDTVLSVYNNTKSIRKTAETLGRNRHAVSIVVKKYGYDPVINGKTGRSDRK